MSYRGKHRKMSAATRTVARVAIAGIAVGAPLAIAATPASATNWDAIAQCESSGNWSISTGNGFFGGLQFTASTWRAFGGAQFADLANHASREQQIVVAERVLAGQGWGAWPVCSRKAGAMGQPATQRSVPAIHLPGAAAPAKPAPVTATPRALTVGQYVVLPGDSLSAIASRHHVAGGWQTIVAKNPSLKNPNRISVGQHLTL
jgi:nucleoid-associated protein YgaU